MATSLYSSELRQRVEALVRGTDRSLTRIAAEAGVAVSAVTYWNRAHGWRPVRSPGFTKPVMLTSRRRNAVERLYRNPSVATADLAAALGVPRCDAAAYFRGCGFDDRRKTLMREPSAQSVRGQTLRRSLRSHIARQIARFDAALGGAEDEGAARLDSAKVLRDLGGLKRLLDEIDTDERKGGGNGEGGDKSAPAGLDLPALRATIVQRYAAFAGEWPDAGLSGQPAA